MNSVSRTIGRPSSRRINWLHLTDLHIGHRLDKWLWPSAKANFLDDLKKTIERNGPLDLVFFTGDCTQSGNAEEFTKFEKELQDIWETAQSGGSSPKLCVVPGNHDLQRPSTTSALALTVPQIWDKEAQLRSVFWQDSSSDHRQQINRLFTPYMDWMSSTSIPLINDPSSSAAIAGDFADIFTVGDYRLGVVGLNSAFLQIVGGDYENRLELHVEQLNVVTKTERERWFESVDACVLLTHHPESWLFNWSREHFRELIAPSGRFIAHFCGHTHVSSSTSTSEGGAKSRHLCVGTSLFGIDDERQRKHGYSFGSIEHTPAEMTLRIWPKVSFKRQDGSRKLSPDPTFELTDDGSISYVVRASHEVTKEALDGDVLTSLSDARSWPSLSQRVPPQHVNVRLLERDQLIQKLVEHRHVWIATPWGSDLRGFLTASIRSRYGTEPIYHIRAQDAADVDELQALFQVQFGASFETFCSSCGDASCTIIFEDAEPELAREANSDGFERMISALLDYCPNSRVVVSSMVESPSDETPKMRVGPLDVPDTRQYLIDHSDSVSEFEDAETVERIFDITEGLPSYIDRIIRETSVSSVEAVLESHGRVIAPDSPIDFPKAMARSIATLDTSADRMERRCFRLLQSLSFLPAGATIESLRHFLSDEPFFPEQARRLLDLALIEVSVVEKIHGNSPDSPSPKNGVKLLRAPRQVRDYVIATITPADRRRMVVACFEWLYGREWRDGKVKSARIDAPEQDGQNGCSNETSSIRHLFESPEDASIADLRRHVATLIATRARQFGAVDRYRDQVKFCRATVDLLDRGSAPREWAQLQLAFGRGLRMTGQLDEAMVCFESIRDGGDAIQGAFDATDYLLSMALCEKSRGNIARAMELAEETIARGKAHSSAVAQARSILVEHGSTGSSRLDQLRELEREARSNGHSVAANNIALDVAGFSRSRKEKVAMYNAVTSSDTGYNQFRACVSKVRLLLDEGEVEQIAKADVLKLKMAYSYFLEQRQQSLFDRAHDTLWRWFEENGDTEALVQLFRHSSFVWRVRGDVEREGKCVVVLRDVVSGGEQNLGSQARGRVAAAFVYLKRRILKFE